MQRETKEERQQRSGGTKAVLFVTPGGGAGDLTQAEYVPLDAQGVPLGHLSLHARQNADLPAFEAVHDPVLKPSF